jgi:hypothetical protein
VILLAEAPLKHGNINVMILFRKLFYNKEIWTKSRVKESPENN